MFFQQRLLILLRVFCYLDLQYFSNFPTTEEITGAINYLKSNKAGF